MKKALSRLQSLELFWPFERAIEDEDAEEEEDESSKLSADDEYFKALIAYTEAYSSLHKTIDALQIEGRKKSAASAVCKKANQKFAEMKELSRTLVLRTGAVMNKDFTQSYLLEIKADDAIHDAEYSIADLRSPKHLLVEPHVELARSYLGRARAASGERALSFAKEAKDIAERKLATLKRDSGGKKAQMRARELLTQLSNRGKLRFNMEDAKAEAHSTDLEQILKLHALLSCAMQNLRDEQDGIEAEVKFATHVLGAKHRNDFQLVRAAEDCADSLTMKIGALDLNYNKAFFLLKQILGAKEALETKTMEALVKQTK